MPLTEIIRASDELLTEVVRGIKLYFNKTLEESLLYRLERKQYADVMKKNDSALPSDIYGVEHFLRLFGNYWCSLHLNDPDGQSTDLSRKPSSNASLNCK
jgi:hypothetical protein